MGTGRKSHHNFAAPDVLARRRMTSAQSRESTLSTIGSKGHDRDHNDVAQAGSALRQVEAEGFRVSLFRLRS